MSRFHVVLYLSADPDKFYTGKIYSIVAYLWIFIGQTDYLPDLMENLGSVKDLNMRFARDDEKRIRQLAENPNDDAINVDLCGMI